MRSSRPDGDRPTNATAPAALLVVAAGFAGMIAAAALTGTSLSPLVWYLARAAGFTLYLLLWLSVVTGLGLTTKLLNRLARRDELWIIHRVATELAFVFLALHMMALALDPSVALGALGVLLPFTSQVRQPWTDLGILAGWGMIGLAVSFSLRRLLRQRGWRLLHYAAFPLWVVALAHGIGAGSDSGHLWAGFLYLSTTAIVLFLSLYRLALSSSGWHSRLRRGDAREHS
jgi:sulfoxide reductase heme-binding subunit YedZ